MKFNVVAKGFDLLPGMHDAIEQELTDLSKIISADPNYRVTIKKRVYGEYECMISTYIRSKNFNVKATRKSIRDAFEAAAKALKGMILESHDKFLTKKMNSAQGVEVHEDASEHNNEVVTKHKEVYLTPISDADAIRKLNDSDFDMFMYLDEATLEVKGVYHRDDGYGVITFKTY